MNKKRTSLYRGVAGIFLALTVILGMVAQVSGSWAEKVNELLGASGATVKRSENAEDYRYRSDYATPADLIVDEIAFNTRLAAEGSVALKGLPELPGKNVTLFGMRSGKRMQFGGSMGELTNAASVVNLASAMAANGFSINPQMVKFYEEMDKDYEPSRASGGNIVSSYTDDDGVNDQGAEINEVPIDKYDAALLDGYKDAAVIVLGRDAGESACFYPGLNGLKNPDEFTNSPTGNILSLSNEERDLVNWVKAQGFGKIVVLLNSGSAMEIEDLKQDTGVDSILWIGNPGAYGTYGIAKLLSGEILPSGHLADTFAVNSALSPAAQNYGIYTFENADDIETTKNHALRAEWYLVEPENIYTGYKYYETRYFDCVLEQGNASAALSGEAVNHSRTWDYDREVSYSFGWGIEGSAFAEEITAANIDWFGDAASTVTVKVTNTGDKAAKHTVQLYVSLPYTDYDKNAGLEKSAIQLVAYGKTGEAQEKTFHDVVLLNPGESEEITLSFNARDLYSYDRTLSHDGVTGAYLLEAGEYWFATGNGAHDAVNAVISAAYPHQNVASTGTAYLVRVNQDVSLTESNGTIIQNRLESADLNNWDAGVTVTYLTRSNWADTFPKAVASLSAPEDMITLLRNAFYDKDAELARYTGPMEFTYGAKNGLKAVDLVGAPYDDPRYDQLIDQMTLEDLIGQYLGFSVELPSIALPKENGADSPLGIIGTIGQRTAGSIYEVSKEDEAYGQHTDVYPAEPVVAAAFSPLLQKEEGRMIGNDALWTGYTDWNAPGMNLHRTPYNGRNLGYYSEDACLAGSAGSYVYQSLNEYGLLALMKHFAFNDQETNRDGIAVFLHEQAARENELRGFQKVVRDGQAKGIMSAFNRIGATQVASDQNLMLGILRGEWGYNGYLITDSVKSTQYFLPREALMAGNDMMLGGSNNGKAWNMTVETVKEDPVIQKGLRDAFHRKLFLRINNVQMNGVTPDTNASGGLVWWELMLRILMGLSLVGFAVNVVLFTVKSRKEGRK